MACKTTFELHHNFPKLAEESGFAFNTHKPRVHIEWRKIKLIDIENIIRNRKFTVVEEHINDILDCALESEFDVRILDEGVLKIFRLAQLAVEYQQFCRHYLDRSVCILREEVTNLVKELDLTKKNLRDKDDENKKIKRKSKHIVRTPLPYGNENIATMILKTLNQNKGDIYNSSTQLDAMQYNKCSYCEKVFMNQLYLKSHITRRHGHVLEIPQRDTIDSNHIPENMNEKLSNEITELKVKLKQMEDLMENMQKFNNSTKEEASPTEIGNLNENEKKLTYAENKEMKDAEVSTNEEGCILDKIEEWKKEEHDKYNEEIKLLRQQIVDIINNKEKQEHSFTNTELKLMEELHTTIKQQGGEILSLKRKIQDDESNEVEKRKEIETQMSYWVKRAEMQSNEYKSLLQKLNEVANEAKEYRAKAQTEREKAETLQKLLLEQQNDTSTKQNQHSPYKDVPHPRIRQDKVRKDDTQKNISKQETKVQRRPTADILTLKKLQQKAQELLNVEQTSTSENSISSDIKSQTKQKKEEIKVNNKKRRKYDTKRKDTILPNSKRNSISYDDVSEIKDMSGKKTKTKSKTIDHGIKKINGFAHIPASPIKVVRAKITEEVNNRLIFLGVDPLKNQIPENIFKKQRKILQEQHQTKNKKIPSREKILHAIITHLDQNTTNASHAQTLQEFSPNKSKSFSLSAVLSNVKTKALSLVKPNEGNNKHIKSQNDLAKNTIALLKTPPGSTNSSPVIKGPKLNSERKNPEVKKKLYRQNSKLLISNTNSRRENMDEQSSTDSTEGSEYSDQENPNVDNTSKVINNLIKSPVRKPTDNTFDIHDATHTTVDIISIPKTEESNFDKHMDTSKYSSDDIDSIKDSSPTKKISLENIAVTKHTKGVLKGASSISSLNKKKVLFDMEAIQMKSVSASPSQSLTDKSDKIEQYELGLVNLDTEEWDISSIENEPHTTTKIQISSRTSPKIAELKQTIESQLIRRNPKLSTTIVGGVDVLATPIQKASFGGSNTSLGSSILDDDSVPVTNRDAFVKSKKFIEKDDSEIEISDLIADTKINKNYKK